MFFQKVLFVFIYLSNNNIQLKITFYPIITFQNYLSSFKIFLFPPLLYLSIGEIPASVSVGGGVSSPTRPVVGVVASPFCISRVGGYGGGGYVGGGGGGAPNTYRYERHGKKTLNLTKITFS